MTEYSKTLFQPARFTKQVDEIAAAIRPAVEAESADKLAKFDKVVAGEAVEAGGFGGPPGGGARAKPVKGFVIARAASVIEQLAGKSEGMLNAGGGPGRGGPGIMIGRMIFPKLDTNQDGSLARDEFLQTFSRWFGEWNTDHSGQLTADQLTSGINKDLMPPMPFGPGRSPQ